MISFLKYTKLQEFTLIALLISLLILNLITIAELHAIKGTLIGLEARVDTLETLIADQERVSGNSLSQINKIKDVVTNPSGVPKITLGIVTVLLLGTLFILITNTNPQLIGESFCMLQDVNSKDINTSNHLNTEGFKSILECFNKNQNFLSEMSHRLSAHIDNVNSNVLRLIANSDLNSLKKISGITFR